MNNATDTGSLSSFRYRDVYEKGKPVHEKNDSFSVKHPPMEISRRAKIFSPFDALKGFGDAVSSKEIKYTKRRELCESDCEELDKKIVVLGELITDSRAAKEKNITVRVTYYVACNDPNSEAYKRLGRYVTAEGIVMNVDRVFGNMTVGNTMIELRNIADIEIL